MTAIPFPARGNSAVRGDRHTVSRDRDELAERTRQLLRKARTAGASERRRLQNQVVVEHLWLAESLARRFDRRGEDLDDLVQVAGGALVDAARRYDPEKGPFLAFAVPTISGVLKRHFRDHAWAIRPPRETQELAVRLRQLWPSLVQHAGCEPSDEQLAEILGEPYAAVREATSAGLCYRTSSIDAAIEAGSMFVSSASDRDLAVCQTRLVVEEVCAQLDPEERHLLWLRFFEEQSQSQIAAELGTSQMQVSRLLTRVLRKLRDLMDDDEDLARPIAS